MDYIQKQIKDSTQYLPNIRPLTEFIHFNLYPALQEKNFWKSMELISQKHSVLVFPWARFYQEKLENKKINPKVLNREIERFVNDDKSFEKIDKDLNRKLKKIHLPEKSYRPINKVLNEKLNYSLKELTEPVLIRFISGFFDQGIADWKMPFHKLSLLECFIEINKTSFIPIYPVKKSFIKKLVGLTAEEVIDNLLSRLFVDEKLKSAYLEECLFSLKGWSAFISNLSANPSLFQDPRKTTVFDYLAVRLIIEASWIDRLSKNFELLTLEDFKVYEIDKKPILKPNDWLSYRILQESLEKTYHFKTLSAVQNKYKAEINKKPTQYKYQALFCMDDRECSLRRGLESISGDVQTFGTPGHFGLDLNFKDGEDSIPNKHCPAPVIPKFVVQSKHKFKKKKLTSFFQDKTNNHNIFFDFIDSLFVGYVYGYKLIYKVLFQNRFNKLFAADKHYSNLEVFDLKPEQAADRLNIVFSTIGLVNQFSKLIYIIGHESTTTNNAYFNAYGCGACSGRTGHINAITFSRFANDPTVRSFLKDKYSIDIPTDCVFIPGVHNTTKDTITFFDQEKLDSEQTKSHFEFLSIKKEALVANAFLRSKDFELIQHLPSSTNWLEEMSNRAHSMFEPRPELGHTGNALCIVGQRSSTLGLSFERRAFLQSYDWTIDPEGTNLNLILSAAVPVCGGINLDYFFARLNPESIGAGSKLSHNVIGLSGLSHGTEDDLLPGLSSQMVELHEPLRILFVVEQKLSVVRKVIENNKAIFEWVKNEWVRFSCLCPETADVYFFQDGDFIKFEGSLYE